jgi:manganese/zinc/iron transport system permease protein
MRLDSWINDRSLHDHGPPTEGDAVETGILTALPGELATERLVAPYSLFSVRGFQVRQVRSGRKRGYVRPTYCAATRTGMDVTRPWVALVVAWSTIAGAMLVANAVFLGVFFKELKLATFDPALAASLGFAPVALHYALMALVSVTAVGAFDAVGSILVVALMIAPAATAWLLTDRLGAMVAWSVGVGIVSAVSGYWLAHALDASIAGAMATMTGVTFVVALVAAPRRGLAVLFHRRITQRWTFAQQLLLIHLLNHEGSAEADEECRRDRLRYHLRWPSAFAARVVRRAERQGLVVERADWIDLTPAGRARARDALLR